MKVRFSTYDLICSLAELQKYVGLRVNQIYDVDHKTYLIRLQKTDEKIIILIESGSRIHTTDFEWPKSAAPSGFSMKMRKHLKNKRLESVKQLGFDRIVDMQFGTAEAAHHLFLELYDKGNIVLTDCDLTILNILRPHTEKETIRYVVREKYVTDKARPCNRTPSCEEVRTLLTSAKPGENLKKVLSHHLECGPAIIDHILLGVGLQGSGKIGKEFDVEKDFTKLVTALAEAEELMTKAGCEVSKGYITQKIEKRPAIDGSLEDFYANQEFHPKLFRQHANSPYIEFETFDKAVDNFFSSMESQKIELKVINQEKNAKKKLDNVKKDHGERLMQLAKTQEADRVKAELITKNQELVDQAIRAVRSALANQMPWPDIQTLVKEAKERGDAVASCIKQLKLDINHITLELSDPYSDSSEEDCEGDSKTKSKPLAMAIDIDLDLTAFANARKFYDQKRTAAKKQQKTIESQGKALKAAEKKTKQTLKEMKAIVNISKARKVFWFEKFFWFISSENYLVIAGRDMMQNELIVKRYMRAGDIYVHADIHGGSSVVIKNPGGEPVPPKTLNEAGVMAISYSVAWDAKVVTSSWWVHAEQVSKTAFSGEYLTAGSFVIRGKKNILPPGNLIMGFSFLFKLEEGSIDRHKDERKVKCLEEDFSSATVSESNDDHDVEVVLSDDDGDEEDEEGRHENEVEPSTPVEDVEEVEENSAVSQFPDMEIKIHRTSEGISVESKPLTSNESQDNEETVVYLGDQNPVTVKKSQPKKNSQKKPKQEIEKNEQETAPREDGNKEEGKLKRGQRSKLKKIKEKYKFQDEEDRQLRLEILQNVVTKKSSKKEKNNSKKAEKPEPGPKPKTAKPPPKEKTQNKESGAESDEEVQEPTVNTDLEVLNSLTGIPDNEDELLFAIPVIAPYNSVQNYKFKVKLTPGTGKRGKAARTAVEMFLKDKTCSQREKDLLRSVKDENLARNIPGKVKVSAPHLHKK